MKSLVLAEKPSVAKDIARVLGCKQNGNGYLEGNQYIVTWALGHLVTLSDPETYDKRYQSWHMEDLPIIPQVLHTTVIKQTSKQYGIVKSQLHRKDVGEIIIATDAGREGELVARWILKQAKVNKTVKRLWISSVTDKAIKEGFAKIKSGKEYENLYASAVARAEADWVVGINATRALTSKYNAQLSCGRVQTPTLSMIARREEEIRSFVPKKFYGVQLHSEKLTFTWQGSQNKEYRTFSKEEAEKVMQKVKGGQGKVVHVKKNLKKTYPGGLYDLTELQRDANKRYGFSAKQTLNVMQSLYETHKILTYPRTDSKYIGKDIVPTLPERVKALSTTDFKKQAAKILQSPIKTNNSFVNDSKVTDHHAIIPTEQRVNYIKLSSEEKKVYDLVIRRFLAALYPPFEYEETTIVLEAAGETFIAKGKRVIHEGFREVYKQIDDVEEELPDQLTTDVHEGDKISDFRTVMTDGETKPPKLLDEAGLLAAMENPTQYMRHRDKGMAKILENTGGLGTVATRADIIEKLFNTFLIEKKEKGISCTGKGKQLLNLAPEELKSPDLTADWERKLTEIAQGRLNKNEFSKEIVRYTHTLIQEIKNSKATFRHDNMTNKKCPVCGKPMLMVNHKNGKMLVCQDRECGTKKMLSKVTNARCPECHKKLELSGEGEGQVFTCVCGYRERLSKFQERKKSETKSMSKKEVQNYLSNKKKEEEKESLNTPFAAALKGIQLDDK